MSSRKGDTMTDVIHETQRHAVSLCRFPHRIWTSPRPISSRSLRSIQWVPEGVFAVRFANVVYQTVRDVKEGVVTKVIGVHNRSDPYFLARSRDDVRMIELYVIEFLLVETLAGQLIWGLLNQDQIDEQMQFA